MQEYVQPAPEDHVFHSSLRLYVLAEHRPKPRQPDWIEVSCIHRGETDYMLAYASPVDARIEQDELNRSGKNYRIFPFDTINPLPFIESHGGRFNVCVIYGFAAHAGHLMADPTSGRVLIALGAWKSFPVPTEIREHLTLDFGDMHGVLGRVYAVAGLASHADTLEELGTYEPVEIDRIAKSARLKIKSRIRREIASEYAVYDVLEQRWRFANLNRVRTHSVC